jgi:hypothetical protein
MRRRLTIGLTIGLLIALAVTGVVLAQGGGIDLSSLPGGGWWVSWQIQNVGTDEANLSVVAIWAHGEGDTTEFSKTTTLGAGQSITFVPGQVNPLEPQLPNGFIGSLVASADQPIVAMGNVANNVLFGGALGIEGGLAAAQYQGISGDDADTRINFPLVKNDFAGQTTTYYVQAAGQAARVTITYKMNDGSTYTDGPYDLLPNQMHVFNPSDAGVPASCPGPSSTATCVGSAVVTSETGPIVGVYTEHETAANPAVFVLSTKGFTPGDADSTIAVPLIKNGWAGRTTALTVQNAEAEATVTVNVEFKGAAGACAGNSYSGTEVTLGPGQSVIYFPPLGNMGGLPDSCFASAIVTATGGKVVATVNEAGANKKTVYSAFGVSKATTKIALPLVKEVFAGRTTGVVIQNVGDEATNVTVTYHVARKLDGPNPGTVTLPPISIGAGESVSLYRISQRSGVWGPAVTELAGTNNGVIIESDGEPIVAIAQESEPGGPSDIKNYEGFNLTP